MTFLFCFAINNIISLWTHAHAKTLKTPFYCTPHTRQHEKFTRACTSMPTMWQQLCDGNQIWKNHAIHFVSLKTLRSTLHWLDWTMVTLYMNRTSNPEHAGVDAWTVAAQPSLFIASTHIQSTLVWTAIVPLESHKTLTIYASSGRSCSQGTIKSPALVHFLFTWCIARTRTWPQTTLLIKLILSNLPAVSVYTLIHMYNIYIYTRTHTYTQLYIYIYMYICMHTYTYIYIWHCSTYIYTCVCVCVTWLTLNVHIMLETFLFLPFLISCLYFDVCFEMICKNFAPGESWQIYQSDWTRTDSTQLASFCVDFTNVHCWWLNSNCDCLDL